MRDINRICRFGKILLLALLRSSFLSIVPFTLRAMPSDTTVVSIALTSPFRRCFDYRLHGRIPVMGTRVSVPFGHQKSLVGIVIESKDNTDSKHKLRPVNEVLDDQPVLSDSLMALCQWCADYYHYPLGEVCHLALPAVLRKPNPMPETRTTLWEITEKGLATSKEALKRAVKQQQVMAIFQVERRLTPEQCKNHAIDSTILRALVKKGLIEKQMVETVPSLPVSTRTLLKEPSLKLTAEQATALENLQYHQFSVSLLEGVTGSGKTEVYLQAIEAVVSRGQQALVLVPEIGLTPQTLSRFEARFNAKISALHSGLSDTQRFAVWQKAQQGQVDIVIGTRSSIFTPLERLGLIIVDEEHDLSYKQQEGVRYSARDLAIVRAQQAAIPLILGSATPALESLHNALIARYQHRQLKARANTQALPSIRCVEAQSMELAPESLQAIQKTLEKGLQVLIFINRRGYAPALVCQDCGWLSECPACDSRMTLHQDGGQRRLHCHHCDHQTTVPSSCPNCNSVRLQALGMGTQRSEQALDALFPQVPVLRIDRDSMSKKGQLEAAFDTIHQQQPCIMIGTQMLAKGHHFASLGLAVILDLDSAFFSSDFRGAERMGQLLTQVSGRVGREQHQGEVIIQTQFADHPLLRQLLDYGYHDYAKQLLAQRQLAKMPPFEYLAVIRCHAQTASLAKGFLQQVRQLAERCINNDTVQFLGPFPMVMEKRNNRYHHYVQLKTAHRGALRDLLKQLCPHIEALKIPKGLHWLVDVDPQEF